MVWSVARTPNAFFPFPSYTAGETPASSSLGRERKGKSDVQGGGWENTWLPVLLQLLWQVQGCLVPYVLQEWKWLGTSSL